MKTPLLGVALCASTVLSGCVLPPPPPLVTVQPARVYERPVYAPGYTVTRLSPGYRTVRYGRSTYYVDRDVYYRRHRGGYVVVNRPY
jgi:hypothetical protein